MVDIVHHVVIGIGGAIVANAFGQEEIAVGFMLGSVLPDLDVALTVLGKARFVRLHQGLTHSLLGAPFMAAAVSAILCLLGDIPFWPLLAGTLAGMIVHVCFDLLNTFGVKILWPSRRKFSLDAFFFIDLFVLGSSLFASGLLWFGWSPLPTVVTWAGFVAVYAGARTAWRRTMARRYRLTSAIPSGIYPLTWFVTRVDDAHILIGRVSGPRQTLEWNAERIPVAPAALLETLRDGDIYSNLETALKLFVPVSVETIDGGLKVTSRCVAVPNFGNRYGETVSTIIDGKVTHETSHL